MRTISQVAELTGISTRTLQYYDEIDLLKPSKLTPSGYRLYNDDALQKLQQILFFKELDFKLNEIREILQKPEYDQTLAFQKQKKLLCLKRDRLDRLIHLLERLEKGEQCMSFKEFDLSEYIEALENFKNTQTEQVIKHWGSVGKFEQVIEKLKNDETHAAELAIKQFGSIEKYTEAMKYNLEHFSELMEQADALAENKDELLKENDALQFRLTSDLTRSPSSDEVQDIVREMIEFTQKNSLGVDLGEGYWDFVIDGYLNETAKEIYDKKFGTGASEFAAEALRYYLHK